MRISDWSSDVCSSDLPSRTPCMPLDATADAPRHRRHPGGRPRAIAPRTARVTVRFSSSELAVVADTAGGTPLSDRSEEHTSAFQSLMRLSYAVFCLKKKTIFQINKTDTEPKKAHKQYRPH